MIGYIMKNRQIAIGIEITGAPSTVTAIRSSAVARLGASLPSAMPAMMHRSTHSVRYRSKNPMPPAGGLVGEAWLMALFYPRGCS